MANRRHVASGFLQPPKRVHSMSELIPKRPLASLTKEECQTLFALAFGYAPPLAYLSVISSGEILTIGFEGSIFNLFPNGGIMCSKFDPHESGAYFNARKLITQLDAYNVAFGDEFINKPLTESGS